MYIIVPFILMAILLAACSPEIRTAAAVPTPEIWQVQLTPALEWLGPMFHACAAQQPGVNLVVSQHSALEMNPLLAEFSFQWGERQQTPPFAAVIGRDELAMVVNPANPVTQLSSDEVKGLFSGKIESWSQLTQTPCADCGANANGVVKAYVYAAGEDVQQAANWIAPGPDAILAPDPAAVRQAVAEQAGSIGFLPGRWVDGTVKQVKISGGDAARLSQPILSLASAEPDGAKRAWLLCVQQKLK